MKGKLRRSRNLLPELRALLAGDFKARMDEILGGKRRRANRVKKRKARRVKGDLPLKGLLRNGQGIYATYKAKSYPAVVYSNGRIRFDGNMYCSPSGAAKAVIDTGAVNGWVFWSYKAEGGNLLPLLNLRR